MKFTAKLLKNDLAVLNDEEDKYWEAKFVEYLDDGYEDEEADHMVWEDMQEQFPRLREFTGISPEIGQGGRLQ